MRRNEWVSETLWASWQLYHSQGPGPRRNPGVHVLTRILNLQIYDLKFLDVWLTSFATTGKSPLPSNTTQKEFLDPRLV